LWAHRKWFLSCFTGQWLPHRGQMHTCWQHPGCYGLAFKWAAAPAVQQQLRVAMNGRASTRVAVAAVACRHRRSRSWECSACVRRSRRRSRSLALSTTVSVVGQFWGLRTHAARVEHPERPRSPQRRANGCGHALCSRRAWMTASWLPIRPRPGIYNGRRSQFLQMYLKAKRSTIRSSSGVCFIWGPGCQYR
jgi:hypothetical protein